jgi:transcriptional regulator with XRE-family HTH domain
MGSTAEERFGRYLRKLRTQRELTLRQVAKLSEMVATDSGGHVSHAYVSQLESGIRVALSLPKLLSLAAVYATPADEVIARAPSRLRADLEHALAKRRLSGLRDPRRLRTLPHLVRRVFVEMGDLLKSRAERVSFPLGLEAEEGLADCCRAAVWTTIVPFVERQSEMPALVAAFRRDAAGDIDQELELTCPLDSRTAFWQIICEHFRDWLIFERNQGRDSLDLIKRWSIEFRAAHDGGHRFWCAFDDPELDERFGVSGVPVRVLETVRWRQLARILFDAGITSHLSPPSSPPPVSEAAVDALTQIIEPEITGPVSNLSERAEWIIEQVHELVARVPSLHRSPSPGAIAEIQAIADFLNRAAESTAMPGEITRPPGCVR